MVIFYGRNTYGKVDSVYEGDEELFYVATQFFHLYWVPLVPLRSHVIISGSEVDDGFRGVDIPYSFKSILVAYTRAAAFFGILFGVFGGIVAFSDSSIGWTNPMLFGGGGFALWMLTLFIGRPSEARVEWLARQLGMIAQPDPGFVCPEYPEAPSMPDNPGLTASPSPWGSNPTATPPPPPTPSWPTPGFAHGTSSPMMASQPLMPPPGRSVQPRPVARSVMIQDAPSPGGRRSGGGGLAVLVTFLLLLGLGAGFLFSPWGKTLLGDGDSKAVAAAEKAPSGAEATAGQEAYEKAQAAYQAEEWQEAAGQAEVAVNLLGGEEAPLEQRIKARRMLGSSYYKLKRYTKAYEQYKMLTKADPKNANDRKTAEAIRALMVKEVDEEGRQLLADARTWHAKGSVNRAERLARESIEKFKKSGNQDGLAQAKAIISDCQRVGNDPAAAEARRQAAKRRARERNSYYYYRR